jgi:predicted transcriptional regulator
MSTITRESAIVFANQLRAARLRALADAEAFDGIVHVVERIGSYLTREQQRKNGRPFALGGYEDALNDLAATSALADLVPAEFRNILTPFKALFQSVKVARNDALHQGAFARHLTKHSIELAIILEDALSDILKPVVTDFMVRNPVYVEPWQPIGFIRQQMLANSFSFLPVSGSGGGWQVVSELEIASFLRQETGSKPRIKRLASTLEEASVKLKPAKFVNAETGLNEVLGLLGDDPILLVLSPTGQGLLGILTAFDIL